LARYRESVCKICRNEGQKLFLKGERCDTPKCAISRRSYGSGQHGQARKKLSEYGIQLREKQKVKRTYGLLEKAFRRSFEAAVHAKGVTGTVMFQRLESRLDAILFRSGLVPSRAQARQLIRHGHFLVNGRRVDIPSYLVKPGQTITVAEKSQALVKSLISGTRRPEAAHWMEVDYDALRVLFRALPEREDIDHTIREQLIIEYYSR
jgi:small subunit ribosomal protein S4